MQRAGRHPKVISRAEIAALLIGLLVALVFVPYVLIFEERNHPTREVFLWLPGSALFETLELRLYDERFTRRGVSEPESLQDIAIVAIDQSSLEVAGQWPWPRRMHAQLIERLNRAGARVVAIDVDFSDRQRPNPDGSLSEDDRALVAATQKWGNVLYPSPFEPELRAEDSSGEGALTYRLTSPFSANEFSDGLEEQTVDVCLAYLPDDLDGRFRRYPFYGTLSGERIGGFAPLVAGVYQNLVSLESREAYNQALKSGLWPRDDGAFEKVPTRTSAFPGRDAPQFEHLLINFFGPGRTFPTYSYIDVLNNFNEPTLRQRFEGKIVFVGPSAVILKDIFPAPLFAREGEEASTSIPGVEIHATATAMLLDGAYIYPPSQSMTLATLFGLTLFSALWTQIIRERVSRIARWVQNRWYRRRALRGVQLRVQDTVWFALYTLVAVLPATVFWQACVWLFVAESQWIAAIYPMLSSLCASGVVLVYLFTRESAERRKVVHQVGLYMDRDVLEEILAHPEEDYPRPRRTDATVLFTDLEGFTPYSEAHSAEEVVSALNAFFTRMRPVIQKHGGSVDKYIGDAIMCFWGVPIPRDDHAVLALRCALEMQEECARFREETGIPFRMRIGLHTGSLIVGSVGSEASDEASAHMNYTVIGDTVNLAARLESKNKEFGSWIMCSQVTLEAAPDVAEVVPARALVKGMSQEAAVFIVRGPQGQIRDHEWGDANEPFNLTSLEATTAPNAAREQTPVEMS